MTLGGNEIVNSARAAQYAGTLGITTVRCGACRDIARVLKDRPYTNPADDEAPWYDPAVPESAGFAGVVGLGFSGLGDGTGGRTSTPLHKGAAIGGLHYGPREIRAKVLLLANSDASYSYGKAWLASALRGSACQRSCAADEACFLAYCPTCVNPPPNPPNPDLDTCGDAAVRTLLDVGLLQGPKELAKHELGDRGVMAELEFALTAGSPDLWRMPVYVTGTGAPNVQPAPPIGPPDNCVEDVNCTIDPDCPPLPAPIRPIAPPDPCFPGPPPLNDTSRTIVTVPPTLLPEWFDKVPILEIRTGDLPLRRTTIRFHGNPNQIPCAEHVDPCTNCAEINIPYLPKGVIFRLDGRTERATVDCPGGPGLDVADVEVYGPDGGLFEWPSLECSASMCIEIITQKSTTAPNSRLDLWMAARQDAG